jgi:hypothetical protein
MAPSHGFAAASYREAALRGAPASHGETAFRGAAGFREARRDTVHPSRNAVLRARVLEVRIHLPPAGSLQTFGSSRALTPLLNPRLVESVPRYRPGASLREPRHLPIAIDGIVY